MKKIPTLYRRVFDGHNVIGIVDETAPELSWVAEGGGTATEKFDGSCCAVIDGIFYKRYDAKKNKHGVLKMPPAGALSCGEPDPVTGHWPHWVKVGEGNPADRWFLEAFKNAEASGGIPYEGTYEAVGPHFQGNPYGLGQDTLARHGSVEISLPDRSFQEIRSYLEGHFIEGIVFWKDGEPQCKIKRRDFGFQWPPGKEEAAMRGGVFPAGRGG